MAVPISSPAKWTYQISAKNELALYLNGKAYCEVVDMSDRSHIKNAKFSANMLFDLCKELVNECRDDELSSFLGVIGNICRDLSARVITHTTL